MFRRRFKRRFRRTGRRFRSKRFVRRVRNIAKKTGEFKYYNADNSTVGVVMNSNGTPIINKIAPDLP